MCVIASEGLQSPIVLLYCWTHFLISHMTRVDGIHPIVGLSWPFPSFHWMWTGAWISPEHCLILTLPFNFLSLRYTQLPEYSILLDVSKIRARLLWLSYLISRLTWGIHFVSWTLVVVAQLYLLCPDMTDCDITSNRCNHILIRNL